MSPLVSFCNTAKGVNLLLCSAAEMHPLFTPLPMKLNLPMFLLIFLAPAAACLLRMLLGLMDMMKDMYDDGDDNTKKLIGERLVSATCGGVP